MCETIRAFVALFTAEFPKNKAAKQGVWRLCLRNAFNQVYPHGG
jgi:hypothetical protein